MDRRPHFDTYQDLADEWRWRLVAANGEIVAHGEAHRDRTDAVRAARTVERMIRNTSFELDIVGDTDA